jgi:hypothetical protein
MKLKQKPNHCSGSQKWHPDSKKKAHQVWSNMKVMPSVFFDYEGVIHHEFLPHCQMVNKVVMKRLREAVMRKGPDL